MNRRVTPAVVKALLLTLAAVAGVEAGATDADADLLEFLGAEAGGDDDWYEFIEIALEGLPFDIEAESKEQEVASAGGGKQ